MKIIARTEDMLKANVEALVIGKFEEQKAPNFNKELQEEYESADSDVGSITTIKTLNKIVPKKLIIVGLGDRKKFHVKHLMNASGKLSRKLRSVTSVITDLHLLHLGGVRAVIDGLMLGNYKYEKYKSEKTKNKLKEVILYTKNVTAVNKLIKIEMIICNAVNYSRDLVNEQPQEKTPAKLIKKLQLKNVQVWDTTRLKKEKFNGTLTVGKGSINAPKAVIIKHMKGKGKPYVFVGKGVTFDTGGYNIKVNDGMLLMKKDMGGAATVFGLFKAIQELNLKVNAIAIVPLAENVISDRAFKPSDIITARNGTTVEVGNTDAEGRLLLMDALCYASELNAEAVIELSTLTGIIHYMLGEHAAGCYTSNDKLWKHVELASSRTNDSVWRLPHWEEFDKYITGEVADLTNVGRGKAGANTAARFLQKFAPENYVHIDMSNMAFATEEHDIFVKGGTGWGVRLLIEFLRL